MKTKQKHNPNWPYISDHLNRILTIGRSGSRKTNALSNVINNQPDIDKLYLHVKYSYESKYQFLINRKESIEFKHFNDSKAFIENSNDIENVYKNIDDYNVENDRKILTVFEDMIVDMKNSNKLNPVVIELFIRGRKLNTSLVFITQSFFDVPKNVRLNATHFCIMKIPNKRELQEIAINHSSDIKTKDFITIYEKYTAEP